MQKIELVYKEHNIKIGESCDFREPNITEDSVFYEGGIPIGFYLKKMPDSMCKLANLANSELRSKRVPKSTMRRSSGFTEGATEKEVLQYSTILGSVPPKPHMRRPYPTISSVHGVKSAELFVKAMFSLAVESERVIAEILPDVYRNQMDIFEQKVEEKWRFGNMFTSSISNYNISAPFHRDAGNIEGCVNVIICKKYNSVGGDLNIPDYDATIGQQDNSMLVYPAWKNVHGVTPIIPTHEGGYRNSLIFYPLKAFLTK